MRHPDREAANTVRGEAGKIRAIIAIGQRRLQPRVATAGRLPNLERKWSAAGSAAVAKAVTRNDEEARLLARAGKSKESNGYSPLLRSSSPNGRAPKDPSIRREGFGPHAWSREPSGPFHWVRRIAAADCSLCTPSTRPRGARRSIGLQPSHFFPLGTLHIESRCVSGVI